MKSARLQLVVDGFGEVFAGEYGGHVRPDGVQVERSAAEADPGVAAGGNIAHMNRFYFGLNFGSAPGVLAEIRQSGCNER